MKILLLNNRYPSDDQPQVATFIKTIKECLEKAGASVDLLVNDNNTAVGKGFRKDLLNYIQKVRQFEDYRSYDIVYCNHLSLYALALKGKFRSMNNIVCHWHGSDIEGVNWRARIRNRISYLFYPSRINHICTSQHCAHLVSKQLGISTSEMNISPSGGIDACHFKPVLKEKESEFVDIGFASGLQELKGIHLVTDLMKEAKKIETKTNRKLVFHFIEYGNQKEEYINIISNLDVRVKFHSPFSKQRMQEFYQELDLLLFPTLKESLGLVPIEAMSCDVPVIGSNDFAIPEYVIPGKSGELFKTGDVDDFVQQTIKCINQLDHYSPRDVVVQNYSQEAVVEGYKELFKKLANPR